MGLDGLARLHGLFAAYKPPGLKWKHLRDTVELQLLKVRGPAFTSLKIGMGHRLDAQASGVLVLGVGRGRRLLTDMYNAHLTKDYTVHGLLGKATDDFCEDGRLVEKTTYDHVTREKLERILSLIQGSHQKALVMYSNVDLQTQEAYEMAVSGVLRPMNKSPMLVTGIRCLQFAPPEFLLEVQCMHETQKQLRRLVHEIGLELKSTAVCTQVRRTRDGFFTLDDALLRTQWDLPSIQDAIQSAAPRVAAELENNLRPGLGTQ
ncbi:pseudouridylate synthase TRUB2, mitochondrial isoform X2 [Phocoena phocoena]|uniref:pseudouridylate synthase TRUB2, mitochondrial isoform X2 n=1 Tax=Phocoena phocoena TaxID=9742 RepID=UPI003306A310